MLQITLYTRTENARNYSLFNIYILYMLRKYELHNPQANGLNFDWIKSDEYIN